MKNISNLIPVFPQEDLITNHPYFNNTPFVMSNLNETSTEDNNCLIVLGTVLEQMNSVCTGANKLEGMLRYESDVIIGGDESEIVICGDAVDGVPSLGTTSKEMPE